MPTCFELILYQTQHVVVELALKTPITSFLNVDCTLNKEIDFLTFNFLFLSVVTLDILVNGNADFPDETNLIMRRAVLNNIKETHRFT